MKENSFRRITDDLVIYKKIPFSTFKNFKLFFEEYNLIAIILNYIQCKKIRK